MSCGGGITPDTDPERPGESRDPVPHDPEPLQQPQYERGRKQLEQPQPALPSPVAKRRHTTVQAGQPRSATKQAPASATSAGASTAVPSLVQTAEATTISLGGVRADGLNDAVATNLTMPAISAAAPQPQTTDSGADVSLAFADSLQEPQPQDEAVAAAPEDDSEDEETGAGRMRLGTMDDSDLYAELDDGEQPDSSMAVAMPSPVKEGEIEEEMVEGSLEQEDQDDDDDDEMETPADEVRS